MQVSKKMAFVMSLMLFIAFDSDAADKAQKNGVVGTPAAGSKFAKLKLGMTLKEVTEKIGAPAKQWEHPTAKASIPFYHGADRWVVQRSYAGEGVLTFNGGGDQVLSQIQVNKDEGKK